MEVDLVQEYGVDLLDLYRGKLSLRKLILLVVRLPRSSRVVQALGVQEFGEGVRWSEETYFLADIANNARISNWLFQNKMWLQNDKRGTEPKFPELIHEPGYVEPKPEVADSGQLLDFFKGSIGG